MYIYYLYVYIYIYVYITIFKILRYPIVRIADLKDCRPVPYRPDRPVPYRPVLNIFLENRECEIFIKCALEKLTDRRPTRRTDPYPFRTVPKYLKSLKIYLLMEFDEKSLLFSVLFENNIKVNETTS